MGARVLINETRSKGVRLFLFGLKRKRVGPVGSRSAGRFSYLHLALPVPPEAKSHPGAWKPGGFSGELPAGTPVPFTLWRCDATSS
jgi:hypothetical protein